MHDFRDQYRRPQYGPRFHVDFSPSFYLVIQGITLGVLFWVCLL